MLSEIFKAYDVRGIYGTTLTEEVAAQIGKAIVSFLTCKELIIGRDMRLSSPKLAAAISKGANELGCNIFDIGEVSTDCLYFASGHLKKPAIMFTASHNPKEYNGIKFCKAGALPLNYDNGLKKVKEIIEKKAFVNVSSKKGSLKTIDVTSEFAAHVRSFAQAGSFGKLRLAVDAGNGMAGKMVPLIFKNTPIEIVPLYFDLDGSFPNHPADPSKFENLRDLQKAIKDKKCDFGMAFDGDADRIFFVDEKASVCNSSLISALIVKELLLNAKKNKGTKSRQKEKIIHNVVTGRIVRETIESYGGKPIKERVGHSYIKDTMRKSKALFGCEHSAHYYYRDNFNADSGLVTSMIVLSIISKSKKALSDLLNEFRKYHTIEETNATVDDKEAKMQEIRRIYMKKAKKIEEMDGISIDMGDWWFNVRPSNTEPLLRLNLEAVSEKLMVEKKEEVLGIMNQKG